MVKYYCVAMLKTPTTIFGLSQIVKSLFLVLLDCNFEIPITYYQQIH